MGWVMLVAHSFHPYRMFCIELSDAALHGELAADFHLDFAQNSLVQATCKAASPM